jgi:hypothetical protein
MRTTQQMDGRYSAQTAGVRTLQHRHEHCWTAPVYQVKDADNHCWGDGRV